MSKELAALPNDVIAVLQPDRRGFQNLGKPLLSRNERLQQQIVTVEVQEVESKIDEPLALTLSRCLHQASIELQLVRPALAFRRLDHELRQLRPDEGRERRIEYARLPRIARPRHDSAAGDGIACWLFGFALWRRRDAGRLCHPGSAAQKVRLVDHSRPNSQNRRSHGLR
jgi:hypothetical protein